MLLFLCNSHFLLNSSELLITAGHVYKDLQEAERVHRDNWGLSEERDLYLLLSTITFLPKFPPNNTLCQPRSEIYCDSLTVLEPCLWPHATSLLLHCDSRAMRVPVPPGRTHGLGMPSMETPWLSVQNTGARLPVVAPQRGWRGGMERSRV